MKYRPQNIKSAILKNLFLDFCPPGSQYLVENWIRDKGFEIRVSKSRISKLGDFRPPRNGRPALITVNEDLHPVEFLVVLAHEIAHFDVYYKSKEKGKWKKARHEVKPHGEEWKAAFRGYVLEMMEAGERGLKGKKGMEGKVSSEGFLEAEVVEALQRCYLERERIAASPCAELKKILEEGKVEKTIRVQDLDAGQVFTIRNGKQFILGEKLRTRYRCKEVRSRRFYTVHALAEVIEIVK